MTVANAHRTTFTEKLRETSSPIGDVVVELSLGHLDLPDALECPTRRWAWFADLLDHRDWGIATELPAIAALCKEVAHLSRQTAVEGASGVLTERWNSFVPTVAVARRFQRSVGEAEALALISELAVDGVDHCSGKDVSGFEALLEYIATVRAVHGSAARQALIRSAEWEPDLCVDQTDSATA